METPKKRFRVKMSPSARPSTAVKTAAKPKTRPAEASQPQQRDPMREESSEPALVSEEQPEQPPVWGDAERWVMLKLLFSWPQRVWRTYHCFCQRVQHARGRDSNYAAVVQAVQAFSRAGCQALSTVSSMLGPSQGTQASTHAADDNDDMASWGAAMLKNLEEVTMSSSFSGVDTPATAFLSLGAGLCQELGLSADHVPRPRNEYAVEWLKASQQELLAHPHGPEHVFGDISEFWKPQLRSKLDAIGARTRWMSCCCRS